MVFVGYISYQSQKEILTKQLEQNLFLLSDSLSVEIEDFISERLIDVNQLKENIVLSNPHSSQKEIKKELNKVVRLNVIYEGAIYTDQHGKVIYDTNEGVIGQDFSKRSWFQPAVSGVNYFSDIYLSPVLKKPLLVLAGPVEKENGEIIGVVSPALNLNDLYQRIDRFANESKSVNLSAYAFLINKSGDYIAHPNRNKILKENYIVKNNISLKGLQDIAKDKQIYYSTTENTVNSFTRIKPIDGFRNEWYIGISVNRDEFYAPLNELLEKYLILFGFMLTIITFGVVKLSKSIVIPVERLVAATSDFASGKWVKPLSINTYKELNHLNRTFNLMMEKLEDREKQLIRSEKLKTAGELAAGLAHEIRNPITTVRGFLQLLGEDTAVKSKAYLPIMIQEVDRVNHIVTDFLAFAKPNASLNRVSTDLNQVVEDVLLLFESQLSLKDVEIHKEYYTLPEMVLDPSFIKQVFINLIQNAIDAMPRGGTIRIATHYIMPEHEIQLTFQDAGIGMDKKTIETIGTPFFTTKAKGTGLGLMVSYRIIQEMNGMILIDSQVGKGTTFTIKLPVFHNDD